MSRRLRLILLLTVLLLILATSGLVALTWSPENPLRFRVISEHLEQSAAYEEKLRILTVEIENTSAATVEVRYAYLGPVNEGAPGEKPVMWGMMGALVEQEQDLCYALPAVIASRQTIRHRLVFEEGVPKDILIREVAIDYAWSSRTQKVTEKLAVWLHKVLPETLTSSLYFRTRNSGHARLEPPS